MSIDFKAINDQYPLPDIMRNGGISLTNVAQGQEYSCVCCFHDDKNPSMSVYRNKDKQWKYHCFSCNAHGDTVSFVKERYGLKNAKEAVEYLTGTIAREPIEPMRHAEKRNIYEGINFIKIPSNMDALEAGKQTPRIYNPKQQKYVTYRPTAVYPYTTRTGELVGYVLRIEFDNRKITPLIRLANGAINGWCHGVMEVRPMYRLKPLVDNPGKPVLIVEGEKCADHAARLLKDSNIVVVSWLGGVKAISRTHWKSLEGREIYIWPDNDAPGRAAAEEIRSIVAPLSTGTYVFDTTGINRPEGWDVADIAETTQAALEEFIFGFKPPAPSDEQQEIIEAAEHEPPVNAGNYMAEMTYDAKTGEPKKTSLSNCQLVLQFDAWFIGLLAFNTFDNSVYLMRKPSWDWRGGKWTPRRLGDDDVTHIQISMERRGFNIKRNDLGSVIMAVAMETKFNPLQDRLNSIEWDGKKRLDEWLITYLGADNSKQSRIFGRKWIIGAVARALNPGCKMDTMLVIEGPQGAKKSTAVKDLCNAVIPNLFTDDMDKPNSKDAAMQMQGAWVIELSELASFSKSEIEHVKAWLTRTTDRFRLPYAKIVTEFNRSCVLVGTHNPVPGAGYLKDPTGARRFWPVKCGEIKGEALKADALQIWAEAVAEYKKGAIWWIEAGAETELARQAQMSRQEIDPYTGLLQQALRGESRVSLGHLMSILEIPRERHSSQLVKRLAVVMHDLGWDTGTEDKMMIFTNPEIKTLNL